MTCTYCWAPMEPSLRTTCSPECHKRNAAWRDWVRESRRAAVLGRKAPKLPNGGAGLAASVSRFVSTKEVAA